jgi:hypothetical protein
MLTHLQRLQALRGRPEDIAANAAFFAEVARVKRWQHRRLAATYDDLSASPRYGLATAFFLDELYGENESAIRDRDLMRMYPTMKRLLPKFAFDTVSAALELDVLSEEFDQALARELMGKQITSASYSAAFRTTGRKADRLHQVELMQAVGHGLDVVVKKPFIYTTLKMLRRPSKMAGLSEMQRFLEAGFTAFRHMNGAEVFLATIAEREIALIELLFSGRDIGSS